MGVDYDPQIAKWAAEYDAIQQREDREREWNARNMLCSGCRRCYIIDDRSELAEYRDCVAFCDADHEFINPNEYPIHYDCLRWEQ